MDGFDILTFTAGVGEKGPESRAKICSYLKFLGVNLDLEKVNQAANTLMYQALTSRASGKLASMKTVIGGN